MNSEYLYFENRTHPFFLKLHVQFFLDKIFEEKTFLINDN